MRFRLQPTPAQEQALLDFAQAMAGFMAGFFADTRRRATWRKAGRREGFQVAGQRGRHRDVRRRPRKMGEVKVAKVGWVRFRWSRAVSEDVRSSRVTGGRAGRWHSALAAIPPPVNGPDMGQVVGVESRQSQAVFRCRACGYADHADVNAARNIAVGRTVTARGSRPVGGPVDREPQLVFSSA